MVLPLPEQEREIMRASTAKKLNQIRNRIYDFYEELNDLAYEIEEAVGECPDTEKGEARRETLETEGETVSQIADSIYGLVDEFDGQIAA